MNQDEIDNLNEKTDIVSLVSKYVKLEKQGKNYKGLCPFHNEKTPSFIVSPEKNMFNCFGCHKAGGPLKFIQEVERVEFPEAVRLLCEFNGIEYKNTKVKVNPNTKYYKIMDTAKQFYNKFLLNDESSSVALEYLKSRGITQEIIDDFEIGLAPNKYDTLYQVLTEMNYMELDMADCGLVDGQNGKYHDLFVNRIMFPLKDDKNNVLGFSARIFGKADPSQPKYINSRDTKICKKSQILFNINLAKSDINKKHRIIIHEGQMDVIASYKSDLKEAVCTLGTALGIEQIKLIKKYTNNVIICYDGDKAGIDSSKKAIKLFKENNFNIHLVLLPDKMDPDEYVMKYGIEKYKEFFENNIIDDTEYLYQVSLIGKNLNDKNELNLLKKEVFSLISSQNSQIVVEKYLNRFSEYLNTSFDAVKADYDKYKNNYQPATVTNVVKPIKPKVIYNTECELRIIYYATKSKNKALEIDEEIRNDLSAFSEESQLLWISLINDYYVEYNEFDVNKFVKRLSDVSLNQYVKLNKVLGESKIKDFSDEDLRECINKIKEIKLRMKNRNLHDKAINSTDTTEQSRLLNEMFENKRKRENKRNSGGNV